MIGVGQRAENSFLKSREGRHWTLVWETLGRGYCAGLLGNVEERKRSWGRKLEQSPKTARKAMWVQLDGWTGSVT